MQGPFSKSPVSSNKGLSHQSLGPHGRSGRTRPPRIERVSIPQSEINEVRPRRMWRKKKVVGNPLWPQRSRRLSQRLFLAAEVGKLQRKKSVVVESEGKGLDLTFVGQHWRLSQVCSKRRWMCRQELSYRGVAEGLWKVGISRDKGTDLARWLPVHALFQFMLKEPRPMGTVWHRGQWGNWPSGPIIPLLGHMGDNWKSFRY